MSITVVHFPDRTMTKQSILNRRLGKLLRQILNARKAYPRLVQN